MIELTEQQQHLSELLQQRQQLSSSLSDLNDRTNNTRDLLLRVEGAIEYLNTIGVFLPEPEVTEETNEEEVVEKSEKDDES